MSTGTGSRTDRLPTAGAPAVRRAAWRYIGRDRTAFALVLLLNMLATAVGLVGPWLLGRIIDVVDSHGSIADINRLALLIVLAALLQMILTRYGRLLGARFGERLSAHIREQFLDRVLDLRPAAVERIATGDLAARGSGDVGNVAVIMRDGAPDILIALLQVAFVVAAVFVVNPLLGVCGVFGLLVLTVATRWYLRRSRSAYLELSAANSTIAEVLVSTVQGARTVEALGLQQRRRDASVDAIESSRRSRLRALALRTVLYPIIDVAYLLPLVGVLLVGGALYGQGRISLDAVVTSALYLRMLAGPLETMQIWLEQLQMSVASFARIEGLAHLPQPQPDSPLAPAGDRIVVDGVRFSYEPGRDVLQDFTLDIRPGERLAIVGSSGAGKSTLGRLLAGLEQPDSGSVTVGGVAVSALPLDQLRRQIMLVTQEHHVFLAPVRDNLLISKTQAADTELVAALRAVGATTWLADLPNGLDTELGPQGYRLNSAQAQQLALARVVLADPHTVILDEATSLLDPATARGTEQALSAVLEGRTVLAIAHRLHTARDADRVAVIEGGRLTELGSHEALVAKDGVYARLWRSWHGGRESAASPAAPGQS